VLAIFLAVAILIVGRIQSGLSKAEASERDAIFMYELSAVLAGLHTRDDIVNTLAKHLQRMFGAEVVEVLFSHPVNRNSPVPEYDGWFNQYQAGFDAAIMGIPLRD